MAEATQHWRSSLALTFNPPRRAGKLWESPQLCLAFFGGRLEIKKLKTCAVCRRQDSVNFRPCEECTSAVLITLSTIQGKDRSSLLRSVLERGDSPCGVPGTKYIDTEFKQHRLVNKCEKIEKCIWSATQNHSEPFRTSSCFCTGGPCSDTELLKALEIKGFR